MVIVKNIELYSLCGRPPAAVFWQSAYRLYPQRVYRRTEQTAPRRGCIRPPPSGTGAIDAPGAGLYPEYTPTPGCRHRHRSHAHVHDDAWCSETEFDDDYFCLYRRI